MLYKWLVINSGYIQMSERGKFRIQMKADIKYGEKIIFYQFMNTAIRYVQCKMEIKNFEKDEPLRGTFSLHLNLQ